ncbi:MAG: C2H2-type zinc finger protein [Planctomycetota bacterium]|jgi:hypothetical protein
MRQAQFLKVAAVSIAAPRYIGAFGASIGVAALDLIPGLAYVEMFTGGAMALLEGFALAFILGKMRLLNPATPQHKTLQRLAWAIVLTLPVIGLPYLLSEQLGLTISQLFANGGLMFALQVFWSLTVLIVPVLVVMAVGYADIDDFERDSLLAEQTAEVKLFKQQIKQNTQQVMQTAEQTLSKPHACEICGRRFESAKGLNGHKAHCKLAANGKQPVSLLSAKGRGQ